MGRGQLVKLRGIERNNTEKENIEYRTRNVECRSNDEKLT
jgi:hypothetical protein